MNFATRRGFNVKKAGLRVRRQRRVSLSLRGWWWRIWKSKRRKGKKKKCTDGVRAALGSEWWWWKSWSSRDRAGGDGSMRWGEGAYYWWAPLSAVRSTRGLVWFHYRADVFLGLFDPLHLREVRYSCASTQTVLVFDLPSRQFGFHAEKVEGEKKNKDQVNRRQSQTGG